MLISSLQPEIVLPPCDHTSETVSIIGRSADDIRPVLPYLNATQPKALFNSAAGTLRFRFEGYQATLRSHEIALAGFEDGEAAIQTLLRLRQLINEIWECREHITPSHVERKRLQALAVYRLLPGTNCRECGESTCFVFANKLAVGRIGIEACTPVCHTMVSLRSDSSSLLCWQPPDNRCLRARLKVGTRETKHRWDHKAERARRRSQRSWISANSQVRPPVRGR